MSAKAVSQSDKPHERIDKLIHEPARLLIMTSLYIVKRADYTYLVRQVGMSMAGISMHLKKLEEAGWVDIEKTFKGKKPYTMVSLNEAGRAAFRAYRQALDEVFEDLLD